MVPALNASVMTPFSTTASTRRWPSMRVTGSTTIRAMSLRLLLVFRVYFRDHAALAYIGHHRMGRDPGQRHKPDARADRVRGALDAEAGDCRKMLIERSVVPEPRLAAANAAMARLDGIAGALVPLHHRTGVVGHRPLAAHLVQAESLARVLVVPRLDEEAGIVVRPPVAGVVYAAPVELLRTSLVVQRGNLPQHQQM